MKEIKEQGPVTIVIFGGTGDLAEKKLIPALFDLYKNESLPNQFNIIGFSRKDLSDEDYQDFMRKSLKAKGKEDFDDFIAHGKYKQGDINIIDTYISLKEYLNKLDDKGGVCTNKMFHLAVPPKLYEPVFKNLSKSKLSEPCSSKEHLDPKTGISTWTRILVEKPFGNDKAEAERLDKLLGKLFDENQIFRIDHYLAKESLQNILSFRFSNSIFEPIWNSQNIERVDIRLFEEFGIEDRGASYDGIGALMDVGQNHMLQMLALIAMEDPVTLKDDAIRKARAKVLSHVAIPKVKESSEYVYRSQYYGYKEEKNVDPDSETETYFKLRANVNTPRWKGTDFYLENGKAMNKTYTEIIVTFRSRPSCVCPIDDDRQHGNVLTFRVQPNEGIDVLFWAKKPGFHFQLDNKELSFDYSSVEERLPDAYERVLFDCIRGDQTLFISTNEILAQWGFIMPILKSWQSVPLEIYNKGSKPEDIKNNL